MVWWLSAALAAEPTVELVPVQREGGDLTVYIRADGQIFVDDVLAAEGNLTAMVREAIDAAPARLVVVAADGGVDYGRVQQAVELVRLAEPRRIAFEQASVRGIAGAPPLDGEVVELGAVTRDDLASLRPRRHRFPQDPYANVSGFTANVLGFGEWKIGLTGLSVGALPGLQIGTAPVLDAVGGYNVFAKAQIVRSQFVDGSLNVQYNRVPGWIFDRLEEASGNVFQGTGGYLGIGATGTLKPADPWSVHLGGYWARPWVKGSEVEIDALPPLLFPGLDVPQTDARLDGQVTGDLLIVSLASDLRFNRRDSVWVWGRVPIYGSARAQISANEVGAEIDNLDVIVAYGDQLPFADTYSVVFGYMASWRNFEMRAGLGTSGVQYLWLLQAFDLTYRFGGEDRRGQREIRQGFRDQRDVVRAEEGVTP